MSNEIRSCIEGEFNGFDEANVYRLENGQVYQQTAHHYHYHYAFRPRVRIFRSGSGLMLEVEGVQRGSSSCRGKLFGRRRNCLGLQRLQWGERVPIRKRTRMEASRVQI